MRSLRRAHEVGEAREEAEGSAGQGLLWFHLPERRVCRPYFVSFFQRLLREMPSSLAARWRFSPVPRIVRRMSSFSYCSMASTSEWELPSSFASAPRPEISGGRWDRSISAPRARIDACWIAWRSSLTFPGNEYSLTAAHAEGEIVSESPASGLNSRRNCSTRSARSPRRSRSVGKWRSKVLMRV